MTTTDTNTLRKSFASVSDFLASSIGNIKIESLQTTHFSNIAQLNADFATLLATENGPASGMSVSHLKTMKTALDRTQRLFRLSETADPSVKTAYKEVEAFITERTNLALVSAPFKRGRLIQR
jgi:hypothetical protein